ncbi:LIVCS family branched-chain amino acid:cation transporter [Arcanobacterium wilhelmae]|uniref:LIVCS family branched-chain amino acid:cation transporter n=1 Tax=Arcanobacterium wilhelmae TaxID=1803177 RepID=A0ABT9NC42_9ACTO|nr:branched-chain amino acid transport system II carrier protein [Arcanobacterium wilhelmae]MDP9801277.1 LIVCS family branched-chain amino acid:cation transporter [Arcanobacterium wilhelmae]WFN90623.1 branched-chain amino acid transport system II carrier protein [Arcanobacterium wilhelmae]
MQIRTLVVTGLALFAMFFGAGNLIIPAMIGVDGGSSAWVGAIGFLSTGVLLPVLSMVALSTKRADEPRLADRMGKTLGLAVTTLIFLFTGMVYVIPRVGAVSFEMGAAPLVGSSPLTLLVYSALFFAVTLALALRPNRIVAHIGIVLTPALLILLLVLIVAAWNAPVVNIEPKGTFATSPVVAGFIQGYFTMDALAAQMFGGVILASLAAAGFTGRNLHRGTAIAGVMAGAILGVIYLGLVAVGLVGTGANGAAVIANVAHAMFGPAGQTVFGAIVLLACLTTALGLTGASVEYFHSLVPAISRRNWLYICIGVSFALTNLGLERILAVVAPANQLLYPIVIVLVVVTLIAAGMRRDLYWAYRLPAWVAGSLSVLEAAWSTGVGAFAPLRSVLDVFPLGSLQMAWVVPAAAALAVGLLLDLRLTRRADVA